MNIKKTTDIDSQIYKDSRQIREEVFMKGQNVPVEIEIDDNEDKATHYTGYTDNEHVATLRVLVLDEQTAKLQRIATLKEHRKNGYAKTLINHVLNDLKGQGLKEVVMGAQSYKIPYYESLGFEVVSEEFMEANIPHKTMSITL